MMATSGKSLGHVEQLTYGLDWVCLRRLVVGLSQLEDRLGWPELAVGLARLGCAWCKAWAVRASRTWLGSPPRVEPGTSMPGRGRSCAELGGLVRVNVNVRCAGLQGVRVFLGCSEPTND